VDPEQLGNGYGFKGVGVYEPDSDKWQVASYIWGPSELVAYEGDTLNLHFFIINGNEHETWIEGPNGETVVAEIEMNRGREYNMRFTPEKAGVYRLICNEHEPSMTAEIVVLPRGGS
jgi:plastocyanin